MCDIRNVDQLNAEIAARLESSRGEIDGVIALFEQHVGPERLLVPDGNEVGGVLWTALANLMERRGLRQAAQLTIWFYHHVCEKQREAGTRYHKGAVTYQAGLYSLQLRQPHEAFWYIVLALIEDILSNVDTPDNALASPAARTLRTVFAVPSAVLEAIPGIVRELNARTDSLSEYPETFAVHLELEKLLPKPLGVGTTEIPLNPHLVERLYERLDEDGIESTAKGDRLEYLAAYLLMTLPGAHVVSKSRTPDHEIDLIITQRTSHNSYLLDVLGRAFIVECKNWDVPVGVEALNHFVSKMRFHRLNRPGIAGDSEV